MFFTLTLTCLCRRTDPPVVPGLAAVYRTTDVGEEPAFISDIGDNLRVEIWMAEIDILPNHGPFATMRR